MAAQVQALGSNLNTMFPGQAGQLGVRVGAQVQTLKSEDGVAIKESGPDVADVAAEYGRARPGRLW